MQLRAYIQERGIPIAEFGRRVGVRLRATMHKYVKGETLPPRDVQENIARETGRLVLPSDLEDTHRAYHASATAGAGKAEGEAA